MAKWVGCQAPAVNRYPKDPSINRQALTNLEGLYDCSYPSRIRITVFLTDDFILHSLKINIKTLSSRDTNKKTHFERTHSNCIQGLEIL